MSETARVDLRQANLSESAPLIEREGDDAQSFIALDSPPPVRSLLRVTVGEDARAFEVARVIEVVDEDEPRRGCYGTFVDAERLAGQSAVGSEHLEPGIASGGGVPAPVVIMNTNEMMLGEAGGDEAEAEAAAAAAEGEGDAEDSDADASSDAEASSDGDGDGDGDGDAEASDDTEASSDDAESQTSDDDDSDIEA